MDTATATITVDLTKCRTLAQPLGHSVTTYHVVGKDNSDDIYRFLGIDEPTFTIFVDVHQSTFSGFGRTAFSHRAMEENPEFVFLPNMEIFLYVVEKGGRHDSHRSAPAGRIHISIPIESYRAERLLFREAQLHHDQYTATLSFSVPNAATISFSCKPQIAETVFGLTFSDRGIECMGNVIEAKIPDRLYRYYDNDPISLSLPTLSTLKRNIRKESNVRSLMQSLKNRDGMSGKSALPTQGIKNVLDRVLAFYEELLRQDEVLLIAVFHTLVFESKRTINGVKVAKFCNEFFADVTDLEAFRAKLQHVYELFAVEESGREWYYSFKFDDFFPKLPGYSELRKQALRSHSGRALAKMVQDIDAVQFDRERYPVLNELINDGSIPVSTFFRKEGDESYFLFNDNWELFNEFLLKHRDIGIRLAKLASQRTTYEKSFMSYLYFVLHELPEYLEKHTGKQWTCIPSIIESAHELDPGPMQPGQTTKKRSALTPIVDNDACTVTVPYACLKVPGVSTTYTYSLNYSIVRRGLSLEGDVCTHDVEEKLNGRDDYGLMFYTLTGTAVGRGYPTFLIIFERLDGDRTRVHFHRTHPMRSKEGDKNPVNNWTRTCYNWMAGNINLGRIKIQQGDLVFVSVDSIPDGELVLVDSYDSHSFSKPVSFIPIMKKDPGNVLGHFRIAEDTLLNHTEHKERMVPAGQYELRQCRSWEANPKGIWSLRID